MTVLDHAISPPAEDAEALKREASVPLPSAAEAEAAAGSVRVCGLRLGAGLHGSTLFVAISAW